MSVPSQIIERCGWCDVKTALNECVRHRASEDHENGYIVQQFWVLYQCVSCSRPTVREEWYHDGYEEWSITVLLPIVDDDMSPLPEPVARAWEAALNVRHVEPNAFAVLVGRTLEVICLEEGANGQTLIQRLTDLVSSNRIPGPLADMAQQLRQIRNLGAHASGSDEVKQADVPVIYEFADALLEYLYQAPSKVETVHARLSKQSQESRGDPF